MRGFTVPLLAALAFLVAMAAPCLGEEIVVSAAASLTNAFREMGRSFERAHPGVAVTLNLAASGALLQQLEQGAPVDVFASADEETMDRASTAGLIDPSTRRVFARNRLVLVAPAGEAEPARGLQDLRGRGVQRIALGEPSFVPAGRYARQVLTASDLWDALEPKLIFANSVRQVLDYVARGEVDAGFVYETDAAQRGEAVRVVATAPGHEPIRYPIAIVRPSHNVKASEAFVDFVLGAEGRAILGRFGFQGP